MSSDDISNILGTTPIEVFSQDGSSSVIIEDGDETTVDFNYARANHYKMIIQSQEAMDIAMRILRSTESPDAVDKVTKLMKTVSDVNKQLLSLSKDKAEVKAVKNDKGQTSPNIGTAVQHQTNIVFSGNSKDLNKLLKGKE